MLVGGGDEKCGVWWGAQGWEGIGGGFGDGGFLVLGSLDAPWVLECERGSLGCYLGGTVSHYGAAPCIQTHRLHSLCVSPPLFCCQQHTHSPPPLSLVTPPLRRLSLSLSLCYSHFLRRHISPLSVSSHSCVSPFRNMFHAYSNIIFTLSKKTL